MRSRLPVSERRTCRLSVSRGRRNAVVREFAMMRRHLTAAIERLASGMDATAIVGSAGCWSTKAGG